MESILIPIGYGSSLSAQRLIAIIAPDASPVKRLREQAYANGKLMIQRMGVERGLFW